MFINSEANTLLAVDPGHTTGWCLFDKDPNTEYVSIQRYDAIAYNNLEWWNLLHTLNPKHVVYERFALYGHKAESQINSEFYTCEIIGITKLFAQLYHVPCDVQTAQIGKSIWKDDKLKQFGYYVKNKHSRDAVRHGLTFWSVHRQPYIRSVWDGKVKAAN